MNEFDKLELCNLINNYLNESVEAELGKVERSVKDTSKIKKFLRKATPVKHKDAEKEFSDDKIKEIKDIESDMRSADDYSTYKPLFTKFCNFFGISPTIIYTIKYEGNKVKIHYDDLDKDMVVPNGSVLTHVSPNEFDELKPSFKSKQKTEDGVSRGGYLYSTPRIFVTLGKNSALMAKNVADLSANTSINAYTIPENIKTVKVDPSIRNDLIGGGAAYIETRFPIKVKKVDLAKEKKDRQKLLAATAAGAAVGVGATIAASKLKDKVSKKDKETKEAAMVELYESFDDKKITKEELDLFLSILR